MKDDTLFSNLKLIILMCVILMLLAGYINLKQCADKIRSVALKLWRNLANTDSTKPAVALN